MESSTRKTFDKAVCYSDPIPVTQITVTLNLGLVLQTCTSVRSPYPLNVAARFHAISLVRISVNFNFGLLIAEMVMR